jgi:hypothetical protein
MQVGPGHGDDPTGLRGPGRQERSGVAEHIQLAQEVVRPVADDHDLLAAESPADHVDAGVDNGDKVEDLVAGVEQHVPDGNGTGNAHAGQHV